MDKPLQGLKIIDFTHVQAGPACTQMLAGPAWTWVKSMILRPCSGLSMCLSP